MDTLTDETVADFWPQRASVGEVIYPPGIVYGPRIQQNLQLVILYHGSMTVWIDGEPQQAGPETVCVLFPGHEERFAFAQTCETRHSWLHAYLPQPPVGLIERLRQLPWPLPLSSALAGLMHRALLLRTTRLPTAQAVLKAMAVEMIWRYIGEGELLTMESGSTFQHPAVERAHQFMTTHLEQPLTLEQIAHAVAVSPTHLIRLFRAQVHQTPMAYLWQQRVAMGVALLEQTGLSVGAIAERCGFQNSHHFSRRVRQSTGHSPAGVRRRAWRR